MAGKAWARTHDAASARGAAWRGGGSTDRRSGRLAIAPVDHPKSEYQRGINGTTGVDLLVGKDGAVEDCTVTASSGSETLDDTACALLKGRARFAAARDANDRKAEFVYRTRVRWQLPNDLALPMPTAPQTLTVAVDTDARGVVENCSVLARPEGASETMTTPCVNFPAGRRLRVLTGADGKPIGTRMTISESISYVRR